MRAQAACDLSVPACDTGAQSPNYHLFVSEVLSNSRRYCSAASGRDENCNFTGKKRLVKLLL